MTYLDYSLMNSICHRLRILLVPLMLPALLSCATKSEPANRDVADPAAATHFTFKTVAASGIPGRAYLFPPLRSNAKGVPVEKLRPVTGANGATVDWKAGSAQSSRLRKILESQLSAAGYEILSFSDLLDNREPYSVLVLSSFYSLPETVSGEGEPEAKACLVMIKGSVFDLDLDPSRKRDVVKVDGLTRYPASHELPDPLGAGFREASRKVGENEQGYVLLHGADG